MTKDDDGAASQGFHVLLAAKESRTRESWAQALQAEGFTCRSVASARPMRDALAHGGPTLVVLEDGLPGGDPLVVFSGNINGERPGLIFIGNEPFGERRAQALSQGADLYLCNPVESVELVFGVYNLAQRIDPGWDLRWTLDLLRWRIVAPNNRTLRLTLKEKLLLRTLMENAGHPVPREEIAMVIQADPRAHGARGIEIMVRRLRKKMSDSLHMDPPLVTLHGVGYVFTARASVQAEDFPGVAHGSRSARPDSSEDD